MAKRRKRAEIREEFVLRLDVFCFLLDQQIEEARELEDQSFFEILQQDVRDKDLMLADFDAQRPWSRPGIQPDPDAPKWSASMHLGGLRDGLNDMLLQVQEAMADEALTGPTRWSRMPETYRAETGRDLFADGGDPVGQIKAILKRGTVQNDEEWRMLNEVVSNVDTTILTDKQARKAEQLMANFESKL